MTPLQQRGRKRTIAAIISILLVSLYSIYIYQSVVPEFKLSKLISQIIRFILTCGLMYLVFIGKKWARTVSLILFSLAVIMAVSFIFSSNFSPLQEIPLYVMIFVYADAIYYFGFSESYKAFAEYQRSKKTFI